MIKKDTLEFLKNLTINNNRDWFAENKEWYERARTDFEQLVASVIKGIAKFDPEMTDLEAKKCVFRIYRDTRFSKDKTPYKNNLGAVMSPEDMGRSSGYYIHMQPGESFVSCGHYMLQAEQIKRIRTGIYEDFDAFQSILNQKQFKTIIGDLCSEEKLQRVPAGFDKNHPAAEYMKLKHFYAMKRITDEELLGAKLDEELVGLFQIMEPLNKYLNHLLRE